LRSWEPCPACHPERSGATWESPGPAPTVWRFPHPRRVSAPGPRVTRRSECSRSYGHRFSRCDIVPFMARCFVRIGWVGPSEVTTRSPRRRGRRGHRRFSVASDVARILRDTWIGNGPAQATKRSPGGSGLWPIRDAPPQRMSVSGSPLLPSAQESRQPPEPQCQHAFSPTPVDAAEDGFVSVLLRSAPLRSAYLAHWLHTRLLRLELSNTVNDILLTERVLTPVVGAAGRC